MVADIAKPGFKNWKDLIPESDCVLDGAVFVGGRIVVCKVGTMLIVR